MKLENKKVKIGLIVVAIMVVLLVTVSSYAYFTASVSGSGQTNVITTGHMEVRFTDGAQIITENMLPGQYVEKTFTVENVGNVDALYDIYFNDVENTFTNKDELVYELISSDGATVTQTQCPDESGILKSNITIGVGETHHYTVKITFRETGENQDANKGKVFQTKISLVQTNTVTRRTEYSRIGYSETLNQNVYDTNFQSLADFRDGITGSAYARKGYISSYVTTDTVYYFDAVYYNPEITSISDCNTLVLNEGCTTCTCYEEDGKILINYPSIDYYDMDECIDSNYYYDDNTGELYPPDDENMSGVCKERKIEPREILIDSESKNDALCFYNEGNEICFDEYIQYEIPSSGSSGGFPRPGDSQLYDPNMPTTFMNMYNKINQQKDFVCFANKRYLVCATDDYEMLEFYSGRLEAYDVYITNYRVYTQKIEFNNLDDCIANISTSRDVCQIINDKIYYYNLTDNTSYDSLESCLSVCGEDCENNESYCLSNYIYSTDNYFGKVTNVLCSLSSGGAECIKPNSM